MHTSVALVALTGFLLGPSPSSEARWLTSYSAAQKLGMDSKRPLALVIGKGVGGLKSLVRDRDWNGEVEVSFAAHYVCVYLDSDRPENQKLVKELEIRSDVGLVLSNRKGDYQAFHHDGPLARAELFRQLKRHGKVDESVVYNESVSNNPQTQSVQTIERVEYRPAYSRSVPSSTYRTVSRSNQNC